MSCWQCDGGPRQEYTARSRWLGEQLRAKRLDARMTPEEAARKLGWSPHKLTGLELGEPGPDDIDVGRFLALFKTSGAESRRFVLANREADRDTWCQSFSSDPTLRVLTPLHEESRASAITGYHPLLIPAPLRTSGYSQAVCGVDQPQLRHDNLKRVDAVFYLDEHALNRIVGNPEVMRDQIAHLLASPAAIRIVPADAPVACEGFAILDNIQEKPVVHVEIAVANLFLEGPDHVAAYRKVVTRFAEVAWDVEASSELLRGLA